MQEEFASKAHVGIDCSRGELGQVVNAERSLKSCDPVQFTSDLPGGSAGPRTDVDHATGASGEYEGTPSVMTLPSPKPQLRGSRVPRVNEG
jgi:hypothetical protein